MKAIVFLGPTLPCEEARGILDAEYRPPAAMGDVYDAVEYGHPDVIGLIDGFFDSIPAVWHKEILFALSRGVRVVGASSMGALRAAELWRLGMEGVGWVFESFRDGRLEDDDEVALLHGPAELGYPALSAPMVNLRVGLQRACEAGLIRTDVRDLLVGLAKSRFYQERSWEQLWKDARERAIPPEVLDQIRDFVNGLKPDVKREDARALLKHLSLSAERTFAPCAEQVPTIFWDRLTRDERRLSMPSAPPARADALRRFVKATEPDLATLLRTSLLIHLATKEFDLGESELPETPHDAAQERFRLRLGLLLAESMQSWLAQTGFSGTEFRSLMTLDARLEAMLALYNTEVDAHLLDALALSGRLPGVLARKAAAEARLQSRSAEGQAPPSRAELEAFYRAKIRHFRGTLRRHARDLGFGSETELLDEVRKIYEPGNDEKGTP